MEIRNSVAVVTGANRGLGRHPRLRSEVNVSSTQAGKSSSEAPRPGAVDMKLEVLVVPVSELDRAKALDVAALAELLRETAEHHDPYEKSAPTHHWSEWYAAYMTARQGSSSPEEASEAAGLHMEGVR
jgi:hypothetical protein